MKFNQNENALINLGYVKFSVDIEAVEKSFTNQRGKKELKNLVRLHAII